MVALQSSASHAQQQECETFDPCLVGVCLNDGTCETSPGNDGDPCDTFNDCTTGTCMDGECQETPANNGGACESTDPCAEEEGTCAAGECVSDALPNGADCRPGSLGPCFVGTCTQIASTMFCLPEPKCPGESNACQYNCNVVTGECESTPTGVCDTACTTATCVPEDDFEYTCTNEQDKPDDTPCFDFNSCNGNQDTCQSGVCTGDGSPAHECGNGAVEAPEECDDGDTEFQEGESCDAACQLVPCGKPTNSSGVRPKASDALFALKSAVGSETCDLAVCDVNDSGGITAADALIILKSAVGGDVSLDCPAA
ncbi:MAG TPA: hypothetical protein VEC57_05090 [Candidatus Limnocylindrales bacterium]|nr:hypothetical protein [Candidatus Limnocylindrales bacterium]